MVLFWYNRHSDSSLYKYRLIYFLYVFFRPSVRHREQLFILLQGTRTFILGLVIDYIFAVKINVYVFTYLHFRDFMTVVIYKDFL